MIKRILLIISLFFIIISNVFAEIPGPWAGEDEIKAWATEEFGGTGYIIVNVQEPMPGQNCFISEASWGMIDKGACTIAPGKTQETATILDFNCPASMTYDCYQEKGFGSLKSIIGTFITFLTYLVLIIGVLFLVISGIMLSMSGFSSGAKEKAKTNIVKALLGLLVLFLGGFLLNQIAPWIYGG